MKRSFICTTCGAMRRVDAHASPRCHKCAGEMVALSAERAQAAHRLSPEERVVWLARGAPIRRGAGRKRWIAVLK